MIRSHDHRARIDRQVLRVVPMYLVREHSRLLTPLCEALERAFEFRVHNRPPRFDPELAFDPGRAQYSSRVLLSLLLNEPGEDASRILAVTGADLFIPVLTYVFGEAQLGGRVAVVSTHRLDPQAYGLPENHELLLSRLEKEAIHELGHTYGLIHCRDSTCVMHASTYAEDIDLKGTAFCRRCEAECAIARWG